MAAICLAFGIPLGGLLYVDHQGRADAAAFLGSERESLELLAPATALLEAQLELEMHRAIGATAALDHVEQRVAERDRRAAVLLEGRTAERLREKPEVAEALRAVARALEIEERSALEDTASAPVAAMVSLFDTVATSGKLSQDSDFACYYLALAVTSTLPEVLDDASNLARLGLEALRSNSFTSEVRTRLIALATALEDDTLALDRYLTNVSRADDADLARALHEPFLRVAASSSRLLDVGEKLGRDAVVKPHVDEVSAHGADTLAASFLLMSEATESLDGRIEQRLAEVSRERLLVVALAAGILVVIAVLFILTAADLRARRTAEEALVHQAAHDPLTGLANRRLFREELVRACAAASRTDTCVGVIFIDLDDFKLVNDRLGHEAGDALLLEVASRVRRTIRSSDIAARLGGDEFAVVLTQLRHERDAEMVGNALLAVLRDPVEIGDRRLGVNASIGVSVAAGDADADVLLANADAAMYAAKQRGKGNVEMFRAATAAANDPQFRLGDLDSALEKCELVLHYQPILSLCDSRFRGVEALLRWQHPVAGLVSPAAFIPYAERTDLIVPIGRWVMREATRQAAGWRSLHGYDDLFVTVNLSTRQLASDDIVDDVRDALEASGLPASALVLEVTETATMTARVDARERLEAIRRLGVRVAIDDFGAGYSSLSYLTDLPADLVKLDKGFIDRLGMDGADELARTMIDLIGRLGYEAVAEGIETERQADLLRRFGCGLGQGFLLSRPMPADHVGALLAGSSLDAPEPVTVGDHA